MLTLNMIASIAASILRLLIVAPQLYETLTKLWTEAVPPDQVPPILGAAIDAAIAEARKNGTP